MLNINPEIIRGIIYKARQIHAKEEAQFPQEELPPGDDWSLQVLADQPDDLTEQEVKMVIDDLEEGQKVSLVALMWIGRGDFSAEEWEQARELAREQRVNQTSRYLLSTPLVADYLEEGLNLVGYPTPIE